MISRWLLIEHPGPWPIEALTTPDFPVEVRSALVAAGRTVGGRVLLIRRPGRARGRSTASSGQATDSLIRSWAVVTPAGTHWGTWSAPDELLVAAAALLQPPPDLDHEPLLLVCAHGVHDTCCALRGRPVAAALAAQWPEAVWECTHVGGDRFAPNLVSLPDGVYYGYLDAADAVAVVERHFSGQVSARHLRGVTRCPPAAQVAVGEAHRRWGPYRVDDVVVRAVSPQAPDRWQIELDVADRGRFTATVRSSARPAAHLTCRAALDTSAHDYTVLALEPALVDGGGADPPISSNQIA